MALTHAQRTSMFSALTGVMGQDDAETLMEHLPPSGWDNVATKDDLRAGFAEITKAMTEGFAQAVVERSEIRAEAATERTEIIKAMTAGFAQAAVERSEIRAEAATELAEVKVQAATGLAQAATERAEIVRRQAWHLYIIVSTIVVATVSIWIALLTQSGAG